MHTLSFSKSYGPRMMFKSTHCLSNGYGMFLNLGIYNSCSISIGHACELTTLKFGMNHIERTMTKRNNVCCIEVLMSLGGH